MEKERCHLNIRIIGCILLCVVSNFGACATECDFESVGPDCNFKNIAYGERSRFDSNINPPRYSDLANDNSLSTCSYTSDKNTIAPWWNLWLPYYTTFKELEFLTIDSHRAHFPHFEVIVYNTTKENFQRKEAMTGGKVCYQHNSSIPSDTKIHVTCDELLFGNVIRIQLHIRDYQLVLCDFRLYGDCTEAFYGKGCERCSNNCNPPEHKGDRYCRSTDGVCLNGCKSGWRGSHCSSECKSGAWGQNCNQHCGNCYNSTCNRISGDCQIGCSAGYKQPRCIEECDNGYYGVNCKTPCNTRCSRSGSHALCDKVNGTCLNGCNAGYKGLLCNKECESEKWGRNCEQHCGNCYNSTCDRENGQCLTGCSAGYKGTRCNQECDHGYYGVNCKTRCNSECLWSSRPRDVCNKVNGTCLNGCKAGYEGLLCDQECKEGKWGENCDNECGHCLSPSCDRINGNCAGGCAAGIKYTRDCKTECDVGTFGDACIFNCSDNCEGGCNKVNGTCDQCKAGWIGDYCKDECKEGKWGLDCQNECGNCLFSSCDHVNGFCIEGCIPGYQATNECKTVCHPGYFGKDCKQQCNPTCTRSGSSMCNNENGSCLNGCLEGYKGSYCEFDNTEKYVTLDKSSHDMLIMLKNGLIVLGSVCVVFIVLYATVITVLFKRMSAQRKDIQPDNRVASRSSLKNAVVESACKTANDTSADINKDSYDYINLAII